MRIAVPAALFVLLLVGFVVLPRPKFAALVGLHSEESAHTEGRLVYAQHCASCHGVKLEGQPNWKQRLASGRLPAPPHDADGHTWHHADSVLFDITKRGTAAVVGGGYESDMPGFDGVLTDKQIRAALAFIKSTWPQRERRHQERITKQSMRQVNR
ncbi:MAG: cytochrome C [Kaistia sp. SCN 65-12]|nr:MAG: cytochrome C [Kaistia sp. SCN 65-12]